MTTTKMTRLIEVALNGDAAGVDPAVRRTLYTIANEHDEAVIEWNERLEIVTNNLTEEVKSTRRLVLGLTMTVVGGIVVGIANILLAF